MVPNKRKRKCFESYIYFSIVKYERLQEDSESIKVSDFNSLCLCKTHTLLAQSFFRVHHHRSMVTIMNECFVVNVSCVRFFPWEDFI